MMLPQIISGSYIQQKQAPAVPSVCNYARVSCMSSYGYGALINSLGLEEVNYASYMLIQLHLDKET